MLFIYDRVYSPGLNLSTGWEPFTEFEIQAKFSLPLSAFLDGSWKAKLPDLLRAAQEDLSDQIVGCMEEAQDLDPDKRNMYIQVKTHPTCLPTDEPSKLGWTVSAVIGLLCHDDPFDDEILGFEEFTEFPWSTTDLEHLDFEVKTKEGRTKLAEAMTKTMVLGPEPYPESEPYPEGLVRYPPVIS